MGAVPCLRCWDRNLICLPQPPPPGLPPSGSPRDDDGGGARESGESAPDDAAVPGGGASDGLAPVNSFLAYFLSRLAVGTGAPVLLAAVAALLHEDRPPSGTRGGVDSELGGMGEVKGASAAAAASGSLLDRRLLEATV